MNAGPARRRLRSVAGWPRGIVASMLALASLPGLAAAQAFTDPTADFRSAYLAAGNPAAPSLDLIGGGVGFDGTAFVFVGAVNGLIVPAAGPDVAYVFGINRGSGTARFSAQGLTGVTNVLFDATLTIRPNGDAAVNLLAPFPVTISLPGVVTISDNFFVALLPAALLPSRGFAPADYTFNLWSRIRTTGSANAEIADFAPDNAVVRSVATVPEPATGLLVASGLLGLAAARRRRARAAG
jgi:hypothetical protein